MSLNIFCGLSFFRCWFVRENRRNCIRFQFLTTILSMTFKLIASEMFLQKKNTHYYGLLPTCVPKKPANYKQYHLLRPTSQTFALLTFFHPSLCMFCSHKLRRILFLSPRGTWNRRKPFADVFVHLYAQHVGIIYSYFAVINSYFPVRRIFCNMSNLEIRPNMAAQKHVERIDQSQCSIVGKWQGKQCRYFVYRGL